MNYRHAFHAGNHGDVLKHAILARVLTYMTSKDKPMAVLDAHAGIGWYDLSGVEAFKTGEWQDGIGRLMGATLRAEAAALLKSYLDIVANRNNGKRVQHYPGSPDIIRALLRPGDRMIFNELHPEDHVKLASRFVSDKRIRITSVDAGQAVRANLPFIERRGLILLDPAYEVADETQRVARILQQALQRMATATILLWYPVTTQAFARDVVAAAHDAAGHAPMLDARLMVREPHKDAGLAGSGVIAINPPWPLHDELVLLLPELAAVLGKGQWGKGSVTWITPPK